MNESLVTQSDADRLLAFLTVFSEPDYEFIKEHISCHPIYTNAVMQFFGIVSMEPWIVDQYDPEQEQEHIETFGYIDKASIAELRLLLTYINRGERFCDGFWGSHIRNGNLVAILKRLGDLRETLPA